MRARQRHLVLGQTGATVVLDSRMLTESNGTALDSWTNRGSLAISPSATSTERPTVERNEQGGNPVVRFDGSNDRLVFSSSTGSFNYLHAGVGTTITTWKHGTSANPNAGYTLYDNNGLFPNNRGTFLIYDDRSAVSRNDAFRFVASGGASATTIDLTLQNFSAPNEFCIWAHITDADNATASERSRAARNAGDETKNNTANAAVSNNNAAFDMTIGRQSNSNAFPMLGDVAQILIWNEKFSEAKSKRFQRASALAFKISCN
jgi:hypothetical protein